MYSKQASKSQIVRGSHIITFKKNPYVILNTQNIRSLKMWSL